MNRWEKFKGLRAITALLIGSALGAGLFPFAPGTMGSLVGIPIAYISQPFPWILRILFWLVVFALGAWAAMVFDETLNTADHSSIVVDEVVGMGISAWTAGDSLVTWVAAFTLFRFFDIVKPFPIRFLDKWSKIQSSPIMRGFGVMIDDVLAGLITLGLIVLGQFFGLLP